MITENVVEKLVKEKIEGTDCFIVDIAVAPGNKIRVLLDKDSDTSINDCVEVSRYIERSLDRDKEDFELQVMSPGIDYPLSSVRQYNKNKGRNVKVKLVEGGTVEGELTDVDEDRITVFTKTKERMEGRKAKRWVEREVVIPFENIVETKIIISFK